MSQAKIYFDGTCPLCVKEMTALRYADTHHQISFIDVTQYCPDHIHYQEAMYELHVETPDGKILKAVDANVFIWRHINRKPWLALLKLPIVRQLTLMAYRVFAKNRQWISRALLGKDKCEQCRWD